VAEPEEIERGLCHCSDVGLDKGAVIIRSGPVGAGNKDHQRLTQVGFSEPARRDAIMTRQKCRPELLQRVEKLHDKTQRFTLDPISRDFSNTGA
jgi:hypothetical protein